MGYVCTVVEQDHLTVIEWRGKIVVNGTSPRVKEFTDFLHNQFDYPVAVSPAATEATCDFDIERHEPRNGFDLAAAVIQMSAALNLEIIIVEEI